ncbi:type IV pilus assembly PilZ [Oleidesulfovibrio alaskensis G20]|jgi:hypothetical protein|uniref:Type IV pilus assembly PilZ n=1 Tax=Oleidesulfovibrio alaskensis (strain ATCC BAA-1058 / DSM 17464 / G20) TaxID=207559 RepID=Q30XP0_OLEA2|nr:PilZ domain-containing protein [Oleidesulfovibrio alaskensis]ABB39556.1 type IV pilus assembly PilZ [Oleidesulfovibrio alaskensis G20]MBG0772384.1 PilZ domain-containing protein [Oleidesulfovibrio alaskensis]MBL3582254.1 PilZ domain-containing protein [Oleidesulfovibrio alaskensis]
MECSGYKPAGDERRLEERIPLDAPVFATVRHEEHTIMVMLDDVSLGGVRLRLAPGQTAPSWLCAGCGVLLEDWPFPAGTAAPLSASVMWLDGGLCGLQFDARLNLTRQELQRLVEASV